MRYFIDANNNYIGGSDTGFLSDFEVPFAPDDARQKWNGTGYDAPSQAEIDAEKATEAAQIVDSPALMSAIEEFSSILQTASIPVPADIMIQ